MGEEIKEARSSLGAHESAEVCRPLDQEQIRRAATPFPTGGQHVGLQCLTAAQGGQQLDYAKPDLARKFRLNRTILELLPPKMRGAV
jgi:hypothetical protein